MNFQTVRIAIQTAIENQTGSVIHCTQQADDTNKLMILCDAFNEEQHPIEGLNIAEFIMYTKRSRLESIVLLNNDTHLFELVAKIWNGYAAEEEHVQESDIVWAIEEYPILLGKRKAEATKPLKLRRTEAGELKVEVDKLADSKLNEIYVMCQTSVSKRLFTLAENDLAMRICAVIDDVWIHRK